ENDGDMDKAMEWLKKKGIAKADKKAGTATTEGAIASYVHFNSKLAVLVEVNCQTDFVAMNSIFKEFCEDVAMQLAANPTVVSVSSADVPEDLKAKERELEMKREDLEGKPDNVKEKMVEGAPPHFCALRQHLEVIIRRSDLWCGPPRAPRLLSALGSGLPAHPPSKPRSEGRSC
ncbi:unnamed protein product, partial [Prorocentrum cordatum]